MKPLRFGKLVYSKIPSVLSYARFLSRSPNLISKTFRTGSDEFAGPIIPLAQPGSTGSITMSCGRSVHTGEITSIGSCRLNGCRHFTSIVAPSGLLLRLKVPIPSRRWSRWLRGCSEHRTNSSIQ